MNRLIPLAAAALVLSGLAAGSAAQAQATRSASATMAVSVEVLPNCTVAAEPLAFGVVTAAEAPTRQATASIEVACGPDVPFTVALDDGQNSGDGTRRALDPATGELIAYEIYADPARSQRWGSFGAQAVTGVTASTGTARLTAYGQLGSETTISAGSYGDVVTVTTNF
jgi:spore coat protein U-like protein